MSNLIEEFADLPLWARVLIVIKSIPIAFTILYIAAILYGAY
ncbi:MAG: hypothetical protein SV760_04205 [Halobacteria archaeon]|nr:hypothetical protein [Halobacteria archaeon]